MIPHRIVAEEGAVDRYAATLGGMTGGSGIRKCTHANGTAATWNMSCPHLPLAPDHS